MASTGSSDVENDEDNNDQTLTPKKVGRAAEYPEFAIIWSYLENFCELLRFPELSLDGLEDGFNSHSARNENCRQLEYLHKKLLVKLNKKFKPDKWEKALLKIAKEQNMLVSWDLENFGYDELKVSTKLELFKMLLECQFDTNNKLKTVINKSYEPDELRLQPFGHDMDGLLYWFHMDEVGGVRLYSTEEDEVDHESWKLLASDLEELENVLEFLRLKCETNPKDIVIAKREEEKKKKQEEKKNTGKKGKKSKKAKQEEEEDDNPCARCYSNVQPDSILLCDKCDAAYHTACLRPPLLNVPSGDWFCPFCEQLVLLERLKEKRTRLMARERLRARQAKRLTKSGMNLSNILQAPGSDEEQADAIRRSGRARKTVDYTFRDFDEEILDAVEKDKKPSLEEGEMNGHPTGKPSFAVERFYSTSSSNAGRRRSRRLKDLDSGSDSESKISDYEYEGSTDDDRPKPPERERHVYLRRHILDDDEDDDEASEAQTNGVGESDNESSDGENGPKAKKAKIADEENDEESSKQEDGENPNDSLNDSQDSNKDNSDSSSEKSGPTIAPTTPKAKSEKNKFDEEKDKDDKETPEAVTAKETTDKDTNDANKDETNEEETTKKKDDEMNKEKKDKDDNDKNNDKSKETKSDDKTDNSVKKDERKATLDVPKSRPPPLERISPKIDPLLDSLGFGALASFSNSDRYPPSRADQYGTLRSPSQTIRSPLSSDAGFSTDRLGVPPSPSSYARVSGDSRYGTYPPSYDQSTSYANYLGYNQTNFSSTASLDGYPGSPSSRQSYPGLNYSGTRQYPGFSPTSLSKRDSSPSYNPPPPYGSTGYSYPSNDMTSRSSYYPSTNQGYSFPTKNPYPAPQAGYYPDDPFGAGMFYGSTGSSMQQGGASSWPTSSSNSSSYYPPTGLG